MRLALCLAAFLTIAAAPAQVRFTAARLVFLTASDGASQVPKILVLKDQPSITKTVGFLKGLGFPKAPLRPGGWRAWGMLTLIRPNKSEIQIYIAPGGNVWPQRGKNGDFVAALGFKEYLQTLAAKAK